ncbi:hypothetical protein T484DRAFT_1761958 [Baffinella frigidus]|nr:hypothetical protein T484DRAFT_1761958 [Cryptophyta sp. CCMP2293]
MSGISMFPANYGYVFGALGCTFITNIWLSIQVGAARKKYDVRADGHKHEQAFNQVQRGHQNSLETLPLFLVQMVMVGLVYPVTCAIFGAIWCVGAVLYMQGYKKSAGSRIVGGLAKHVDPQELTKHIADMGILFPTMRIAYDLIMAQKTWF